MSVDFMPFPPIARLACDLASGAVTSRALVEIALERIFCQAGQGSSVFIETDAAAARTAADMQDRLRAAGAILSPLAGIPVSVKDLFDIAGQVTRAGSLALAGAPPAKADAPAVARLRQAGAIIVGRTNMAEFAMSGLGLNPHYGTPVSPYRRGIVGDERIAGGSSSGAAASVADGMAAIALGSDTGGSIRIPAAFTGLTGFKPTASRIPREGAVPLSTSLDSFGPIGVSVACCAITDRILAGLEPVVPMPRQTDGLRVGVMTNYMTDNIEDPVASAIDLALRRIEASGATIADVRFPPIERLPDISYLATIEAYAWHRHVIADHATEYDPRMLRRILKAVDASASDYAALLAERQAFIEAGYRSLWGHFDVIVAPTAPILPPRVVDCQLDDEYERINALVLRNPRIFNMLNACAISLPCHSHGEAPVGLMLAAAPGRDDTLLAVALSIERVLAPVR